MCGRFDTTHLTWAEIHELLSLNGTVKSAAQNMEPNDDVRPTTSQLVARREEDGWVLERRRWGVVPFFYKARLAPTEPKGSDGFKLTTFNCKVENFDPGEKPSAMWKGPFQRNRCLVPASSWYEWTGPKGNKTKHRFSRVDGKPIWFAGLHERATTSDVGEVKSFTIMTGPSAGMLADYHDRAPVILEPEEFDHWLDPSRDAYDLMRQVRAERFQVADA